MPPLCKALDINHLWPSRYAVPTWPPRFLMRKRRRGVHTTMQWGCWGSKPAHPDCRASSHPTIPPASLQLSFGFGFYFQGEAQSMSLVPPAFTPNATLLKTPKGTNDIQGGPYSMKPDTGCPTVPQTYPGHQTLSASASQESTSARKALPPLSVSPELCPRSTLAGYKSDLRGLASELWTITIQSLLFTSRAKILRS